MTYEEKKLRLVNNLSRNYNASNLQIVQTPSILGFDENISDAIREIIFREGREIQSRSNSPRTQNMPYQELNREEVPLDLNSLRDDIIRELGSLREIMGGTTENDQETSEVVVERSLREEMYEELERLRRKRDGEDEIDERFYDNLTAEEKLILDNFVEFFSICPVCNQKNHRSI